MTSHQEIAQLILKRQAALAEGVIARQYERQPALKARYGETEHAKSLRDTRYHLTYLAEALAAERPALFADYIAWARPMLESHNVPLQVLTVTLACIRETLLAELPPAMRAPLEPYLDAGDAQLLPDAVQLSSFVDAGAPLGALARRYLDVLLRGDRQQASRLILDAVDGGAPVKDIYLHVFQPVQYEIGLLWQTNRISVAQEHYATAVTQLVMSQLYPHIFSTARRGHALVATCVGGELHEIGVRMVADFFEMAGWDTFYLGANTPPASIVRAIEERQADVLAVSATISMHVSKVARLIEAVRASEARDVRVMVGGYPFNRVPDLWEQVGADGYASDADAAISVAEGWVADGA